MKDKDKGKFTFTCKVKELHAIPLNLMAVCQLGSEAPVPLMSSGKLTIPLHRYWPLLVLLPAFAVLLWARLMGFITLPHFGDSGALEGFVVSGTVFPRWLLGSWLLNLLHKTFGTPRPDLFIAITGFIVHAAGTILLFRFSTKILPAIAVAASPLWILFGTGYSEYYPFISGLLLCSVVFAATCEKPEERWIALGIIAGALSASYIAFIPIAALCLIPLTLRSPKRAFGAAVIGAGVVCAAIFVTYGDGGFIEALRPHVTAETGLPKRFIGHTILGGSAFTPSYAFSAEHLWRVADLLWRSGTLPLLIILLAVGVKTGLYRARTADNGPRLLLLGLVCFELIYLLFMVPRLGWKRDFDLFFQSYFILVFAAAYFVDEDRLSPRAKNLTAAILILIGALFTFSLKR